MQQNNLNHNFKTWNLHPSKLARNTHDEIQEFMDNIVIKPNLEKSFITLSLGDPTIFENFKLFDGTVEAIKRSVESCKYNGYVHTIGLIEAREAIAKYVAHQGPVTSDDIIICSGCSSALEICLLTIAESGQNILVPRPSCTLYSSLCAGMEIEVRYYNLLPEKDWEADLLQMESLIDKNTATIVINNPSNPCGGVFSRQHLQNILELAAKYFLPIIADEIYEHLVFPGFKHIPISSLSEDVPILSCGGLTMRFLVPGWRTGWIVIHDRKNRLKNVSVGLKQMATRISGSNTIVQGALPEILLKTPNSCFENFLKVVSDNANLAYKALARIRGLRPVKPKGAFYMMIGINMECFAGISTDMQFIQDLVDEQNLLCLPGSCVQCPNYFRIVLTSPKHILIEACSRLGDFCEKHYKF